MSGWNEPLLRESQKWSKWPLYWRMILLTSLSLPLITVFFDKMSVLKHLWLALAAALTIFYAYSLYMLPYLKENFALVKGSSFKANSLVIVSAYILGSSSGAGLMTAIVNVVGISAFYKIVTPVLPNLFYPTLSATASVVFMIFAVFKTMHYLLSLPLALLFAAMAYFSLKSGKEIDNHGHDIELSWALSKNTDSPKLFTLKEIFKAVISLGFALLISVGVFYWVLLSINPFWMRAERISKFETLDRLPHDQNLRVREVSSLADLAYYKKRLNSFPMVIKPSICTTNSRNVMKCDNFKCLELYLKEQLQEIPKGGAWVIQEYSKGHEGVVFYYKFPYQSGGAIKNIGIRGDAIKDKFESGTSLTSKYWPGEFKTDFSEDYVKYFDKLAAKVPGFNGGRFDVMLPDTELKNPRGIEVLELNVFFLGCIEEKKTKSVLDELRRLRTSIFQLYVGVVNIVAGYNYLSAFGIVLKIPELVNRTFMCQNHEHLLAKP